MKVTVKRGNKEFEVNVKRAIELLGILESGDICRISKYTVERIGSHIYFKNSQIRHEKENNAMKEIYLYYNGKLIDECISENASEEMRSIKEDTEFEVIVNNTMKQVTLFYEGKFLNSYFARTIEECLDKIADISKFNIVVIDGAKRYVFEAGLDTNNWKIGEIKMVNE